MSDTAMIALMIALGLAALALPFVVYALMPQKLLKLASDHGRYAGLGTADPSHGATGNASAVVIGSLQGHAGQCQY